MQTINEETGFWKPSCGSIYPHLQSLVEAGLIDFRTEDRKKVYYLTEKGRQAWSEVAEARDQMAQAITRWSQVYERVFGADDPVRPHDHPHRLGRHVPEKVRERFAALHHALRVSSQIDEEVEQKLTSLLDQAIELLKKDEAE